MKGQATLTDHFAKPSEKVAVADQFVESNNMIAVFDCHNCQNNKARKGALVLCMRKWKSEPTDGCACHSDGKELEHMASFAPEPGFVPKKWRGEA